MITHVQGRRLITTDRVVIGLLLLVIGFFLLASVPFWGGTSAYLVFVLATVVIVRSVPVEPGAWLGLRRVRRGLVVVISLITLDFTTMRYADPNVAGPALLIALALCDFALGRATRRLASAEEDTVDERQEALRNRAYRIAYVVLALLVGAVVAIAEVATPSTRQWLGDAIRGGGALISFIQLLFFLPAMVIAWIEPDRISDEEAPRFRRGLRARLAPAMVAMCVAIPIVLSLALAVAPIRTSSFTQPQAAFQSSPAGTVVDCTYFDARKQVGIGFEATIPLTAVACWNGTAASEDWGLNDSDCHPRQTELLVDSTLTCRRTVDAAGTLHFTYQTRLRSAFLPFISRDVVMTLAVAKDGKVVQFP